jgi:hypothetical protein
VASRNEARAARDQSVGQMKVAASDQSKEFADI